MNIRCNGEGTERVWELENDFLQVVLKADQLALSVTDKKVGKHWEMQPETTGFIIQKAGRQMHKPLADLQLEKWREVREGVYRGVELMSVPLDAWQVYNVRVRVLVSQEAPDLLISVRPHEDPGYTGDTWVREVHYPRSLRHSSSGKAGTVVPLISGVSMPGNLDMDLTGEHVVGTFSPWNWNGCSGPWWGHIDESGASYAAIIETPDDACFDFAHPAGGPTRIAPCWLSSFEALRYERRIAYRFFAQADHMVLALHYRDYCMRIGRWRSIEEKLLEKPQMATVPGAAYLSVMALCQHLNPGKIDRTFNSFSDIAARLSTFAQEHKGENVFFNLRGWQVAGYDHMHPAACPPSAELGGWDGMRLVSETAAKHGAVFSLHEQYRDFFLSSPWFSEDRTRKDSRRDSPRHHYWAGGTQSILCPSLMLDFVKMSVQQLVDQHVRPNATYQDVLTAIPLEECYDQRHPVSRTKCREVRNEIFNYYRTLGWLITSECATDWGVPLSDSMPVKMPIVNHGKHARQIPGTPLPLFSLAFHDSVLLNNWGVPPLEAALWGVNAYYPEHPGLFSAIKETAFMPLTAHRLLAPDGSEQESVFGNTVKVRANLKTGAYEVSGLKGGAQKGVVKENSARR